MSPNIEFLKRCSVETGYRADILEKVIRLGKFADEISQHPFLGQVLAIKGGNAVCSYADGLIDVVEGVFNDCPILFLAKNNAD